MISICIITQDAESTLHDCILSIGELGEIVVVDSGSRDATRRIALDCGAVFIENPWSGFGPQKNFAINAAQHDWILSIDADEIASQELVRSIEKLDLSDINICYRIQRANYLNGKKMRFSGWGNDQVIRLFNRKATRFHDLPVHESVIPTRVVRKLSGELVHHPYPTPADFERKTLQYASLAHQRIRQKVAKPEAMWISLLRAGWAFCRPFILKLGFLDGSAGFRIATMGARYTFLKYHGVTKDTD